MKLPSKKELILIFISCILMILLTNQIMFSMAKTICDKSEIRPVRYEMVGLLKNHKIPIVTTAENADGYEEVCISTGQPKFWSPFENLEYMANKMKENKK